MTKKKVGIKDYSEKCARCGEVGEDRRTLHMACFYAMNELNIPFEREVLFSAKPEELTPAAAPVALDLKDGKKLTIQSGTVKCSGELLPYEQFTLRVCKSCRADWMSSIQKWFDTKADASKRCGSGIFIRKNGATVEITQEEWDRMHPNQEPVRFVSE